MGAFDDLLTVQEHDSAIDRLRVRRERLPERAELAEREGEAADLERQLTGIVSERDGVATEEKRLDDQRSALEERTSQVEADLYSGATSSPRELQAMQAEIEQFRRQLSTLEDRELDAMEHRERLDGEVARLEEGLRGARSEIDRLRTAIEDQEREIDGAIGEERSAREAKASALPSDLLELYEKVRSNNRGVGAAPLVSGTCQACHLALPTVELDRIKKLAPDELVRCEQCGAILVRS